MGDKLGDTKPNVPCGNGRLRKRFLGLSDLVNVLLGIVSCGNDIIKGQGYVGYLLTDFCLARSLTMTVGWG